MNRDKFWIVITEYTDDGTRIASSPRISSLQGAKEHARIELNQHLGADRDRQAVILESVLCGKIDEIPVTWELY